MSKRRALLSIAAVVGGLFLVGAILVPVLSRDDTVVTGYAGRDVRRVEVTSDRGAVHVRAGDPRVEQRRSWILGAPDVTQALVDGVLRVNVTCPSWSVVSCSADVTVTVPADVEVSVDAVRGDVTVTGMGGDVTALSEDGSVGVAASRSNRVEARSVTESVTVTSRVPPRLVRARSETGGVTITIPAGEYAVDAVSAEGDTVVEGVRDVAAAAGRIEARSGLGDIRVIGR